MIQVQILPPAAKFLKKLKDKKLKSLYKEAIEMTVDEKISLYNAVTCAIQTGDI